MTEPTTDRHTCHDQRAATSPAWKCPRCSAAPLPPADPADQAAAPSAVVRKTLRRWAYAAGHIESELDGAVDRMYELVARDVLRRVADETAATETPEWARPETEEEKLAKCRRMAKAMSAPPVAPSEWETTTEWPGRHKRPGDRRVHATARFVVNDTQQFWTACGERVGRGGTPMSHMPVGCRGCKRATAAGARQDGAQR